ncbi:MAG: DUF58 domain-containing protein [Acidimicrobiales bacterium]
MLTRQGWICAGVALVLLAAGRILGTLELFLLGAVLAALVLVCAAYVALRRLHVDVVRELHPPRVHAGSPSRVDLRVENRGGRTSPVLGLRDAVSGTRGAHLLVGPLAPDATARAAYRLPTERRGILEIGPLRAELTDPFGMARMSMTASGVSELTVYPHIDEIAPVPQTTGNDPLAGAEHPNALGRNGEDFYALRQYVVGDDLRRVHWPSTARHDELMVRQDELPWQGRATVLVDNRAAATSPESLELVVSAAASIVNAGARRQDLVRLITADGADSGFAAGHGHVEAIMEHLASVEASPDEAGLRRVVERVAQSSTGGALVVVCTARLPTADRDRLRRLRSRFGSLTIVCFDESAADPAAPEVPRDGGDGLLWVTRQRPFREVWNRAMRPRAGPTLGRTAAPLAESRR